jgi:hypothetical protein
MDTILQKGTIDKLPAMEVITTRTLSENREIYRSIRITRALFPHAKLRFRGRFWAG